MKLTWKKTTDIPEFEEIVHRFTECILLTKHNMFFHRDVKGSYSTERDIP